MANIKINLQTEELAAVSRRATELKLSPEAFAYSALSCAMSHIQEGPWQKMIARAASVEGKDLPLWSDSARSVSAYEGKEDVASLRGPKGKPLRTGMAR